MAENDGKQSHDEDVRPKKIEVTGSIQGSTLHLAGFDEIQRAAKGMTEGIMSLRGPIISDAGLYGSSLHTVSSVEASQISSRLANIEKGLTEVKNSQSKDNQLLLDDLIKKIADAKGETENLAARLLLPPRGLTDQQLVPIHLLERWEEYRSDENYVLLLAGTFGGAILGVFSSLAVSEELAVTRSLFLFLLLLGVITVICVWWAYVLHKRAADLKQRMFDDFKMADNAVTDLGK